MFFLSQDSEEKFCRVFSGVVDQDYANQLRVKAFGSSWKAEFAASVCQELPMVQGQKVQVLGRRGLSLIIAPEHP